MLSWQLEAPCFPVNTTTPNPSLPSITPCTTWLSFLPPMRAPPSLSSTDIPHSNASVSAFISECWEHTYSTGVSVARSLRYSVCSWCTRTKAPWPSWLRSMKCRPYVLIFFTVAINISEKFCLVSRKRSWWVLIWLLHHQASASHSSASTPVLSTPPPLGWRLHSQR